MPRRSLHDDGHDGDDIQDVEPPPSQRPAAQYLSKASGARPSDLFDPWLDPRKPTPPGDPSDDVFTPEPLANPLSSQLSGPNPPSDYDHDNPAAYQASSSLPLRPSNTSQGDSYSSHPHLDRPDEPSQTLLPDGTQLSAQQLAMAAAVAAATRRSSIGTSRSRERDSRLHSRASSPSPRRNQSREFRHRQNHCHSPPPLDADDDDDDDDDDDWHGSTTDSDASDDAELQREVDAKWILNVSVRFPDKPDEEKFFVTYAEQENVWRRVTVSYNWKEAPFDSLETDLHALHYQRQKSARIYSALRASLAAIRFYDTVTNLKLKTSGGRLHVHVAEDINEQIQYPPLSAVNHLRGDDFQAYSEREVNFSTHLSGFVYKINVSDNVVVDGKTTTRSIDLVKKEIPSRDTVQEFLYEINSLYAMRHEPEIIAFRGIVVDEDRALIKGLLIDYAQKGTLVDILGDKPQTLPWARRQKWATQIITGLYKLHAYGFVQGDFTLSNVVLDANDDAKIIDINRRGCPLGWEPPEFMGNIHSGQRISMYIGNKSDVYQLGMVLWGIARCVDEPDKHEKKFLFTDDEYPEDVPIFFRQLIKACLHPRPKSRTSTERIISTCRELFPLGYIPDFDPTDSTDDMDAYDDYEYENVSSSMVPRLTRPSPPPLPLSSHAALQNAVDNSPDISTLPVAAHQTEFEPHPPMHHDSGFSEAHFGMDAEPNYVRDGESGLLEKIDGEANPRDNGQREHREHRVRDRNRQRASMDATNARRGQDEEPGEDAIDDDVSALSPVNHDVGTDDFDLSDDDDGLMSYAPSDTPSVLAGIGAGQTIPRARRRPTPNVASGSTNASSRRR